MRQLYYTFRTLLRGRGGNLTKIISLTLGLLVGILLFARVAFELNYDSYYQEPENLFQLYVQLFRKVKRKSLFVVITENFQQQFVKIFLMKWKMQL